MKPKFCGCRACRIGLRTSRMHSEVRASLRAARNQNKTKLNNSLKTKDFDVVLDDRVKIIYTD